MVRSSMVASVAGILVLVRRLVLEEAVAVCCESARDMSKSPIDVLERSYAAYNGAHTHDAHGQRTLPYQ